MSKKEGASVAPVRRIISAWLAISVLFGAACGKGGGGGTVTGPTTPTPPIVPEAQPPTVDIGGGPQTPVPWIGQASSDQVGVGGFGLTLVQTGTDVTGTIGALGHSGPLAGKVSANTFSFNFSQTGNNQGQSCGTLSGTATVSSVNTMTDTGPNTMNTMTGTFSGSDCSGKPITGGVFNASLQDPTLQDQSNSATRFPVAGTWKGLAPPSLGGGAWTWTLAQSGGITGGSLTGSVTFTNGDTLNLGTGTVTGTVTNSFPGPPQMVSAVTTVSFTGACPATLTVNWGYGDKGGLQLNASGISGSACNGPLPPMPRPGLRRQ
jgi:hypothetical protein